MSVSRIALVAEDVRFATALQTHLTRIIGQAVLHCSFSSVRDHLAPDADGLLLLGCAGADDAEAILRLVQEIYLRKLPQLLVLLESDGRAISQDLSALDSYVVSRLRWPRDAESMAKLVNERVRRFGRVPGSQPETVEQVISRRLMSHTPSLLPLVERIALAAAHDVTVLLTGETGTGKTHLARLMHECSPRHAAPFLTVPCGALPGNLVESAFFGHERGAFTGADRARAGKFEAAGNGTILLDEIDTLPLEQQAALLRVIETGEYEPVGSNETKVCTARIIVASNWDLESAVETGKFREDLYYRLNVMSFHLPPLRERVQDIGPLGRAMAARFNHKFRKHLFDISPEAIEALENHPWPGNIRQLENVLQQGVLMSSGPELLLEHLPPELRERRLEPGLEKRSAWQRNREQTERAAIQSALAAHGNSRSRAARALGISRVTLYKKMKKYGLMEDSMRSGGE
jgi:DNA-binding NtrC family response regulator